MPSPEMTSKELAALSGSTDLMDRLWAPCRYNCPVHADVRRYIELAAQGRWVESLDVIRENLPFAGVCGRICHHPCEQNCRRGDVDQPIAIREIKRFVAELIGAGGCSVDRAVPRTKARVAIVGGGPAGMSAALELAKQGYRPTVFERFPVAGGIPATAIPRYRMPLDVVQIDIDWIAAHGVEVVTGVRIGKDKTLADLKAEGFEAVVVAAGLALSRTLPLPGSDHPRVYPVLKFLQALNFGQGVDVGKSVLVIGGGNVACDAARSAVRLGAAVRMMCLENEEEMPAWDWERDEAVEEGVQITYRRGPVEVKTAAGKIVGLVHRGVKRVFDEQKRFAPEYDDADRGEIACDTIVMAIGQMADFDFAEGAGLARDARGRLVWDRATQQTSQPWVFAAGEIVTPPGSIVEACASGRRAAKAVDLYLTGRVIAIDDTLPPAIDKIHEPTKELVPHVARAEVPTDAPEVRKKVFAEFARTLSDSAALCDAQRCMNCGGGAQVLSDKCSVCLTCQRVCPFEVPKVTDVARIDPELCQACGICIAACPANAIVPRSRPADEIVRRTRAALAGGAKIVAYVSGHHASPAAWRGEDTPAPAGVAEIMLPSTAWLSAGDLLAAFECGATGVIVVAAGPDGERYPTATARTRAYVAQARELLGEVGIGPARLQMAETAADRSAVVAAMAEAVGKIG